MESQSPSPIFFYLCTHEEQKLEKKLEIDETLCSEDKAD